MIGRTRAVERAVRDSASAIADGRALHAIDELTTLNRRRRDPRLEGQLVRLRHAAAAELPKTGRAEWPPALADLFPDEHGLPRIDVRELSGSTLGGAIANHGCLKVDHMIDPRAVPRLVDHIERAFDARSRLYDGADADAVAPWYVPFDKGRDLADGYSTQFFIRLVDSPALMWDIVELYESRGVVAAVGEYLGERPAMIAHKWLMRRALHGADTTDFHQDGAFLGKGIRTVNCWIALADCGHDMPRPGLEVVPGRFDIISPGVASKHAWSLAESTVLEAAPQVTVCAPVISAGDALFFDERTPHRTTNGPDLLGRYAIEAWFVAPSSALDEHEPILL
jgi:hypothetical protein